MADAEAIFHEYAQDPEVTRYVSWRSHRNIEETREFLRVCRQARVAKKSIQWVIVRKADDRLLGMVGMRGGGHKWELGYVLARRYWGNGYMTEAVRTLVDWALAQPDIFRVWAVCDVDNLASARVMERVGMAREALLCRWSVHPNVSPAPRDSYCYSMVK